MSDVKKEELGFVGDGKNQNLLLVSLRRRKYRRAPPPPEERDAPWNGNYR